MGESWSEPFIGKVKVEESGNLVERWVAFVGGGFDYSNILGRAFFVVDIKTGDILWEFSYEDKAEEKSFMNHALAASAVGADINSDGFIDRVYMGDLGGQMWVFDVSFNAATQKSNSQWSGKRLFKAPATPTEKHPIYYQPAVAFDQNKNPWVYFGTGDREYPKNLINPPERFFALRDDGMGAYPRTVDLLSNVTFSNTYAQDPTKKGWYIQLEKSGDRSEKVLAKPAIFNRLVYFTTFTYVDTADPCTVSGISRLYIVEYLSGGGATNFSDQSYLNETTSQRTIEIGTGVPSSPVISINLKGQATVIIGTTSGQVFSQQIFSPAKLKDLLYWRKVTP